MGARTGANALNRVIDAEIDARNPRTADSQIPKGEMKKGEVLLFTAICFLFMFIGAYQLNWLSFRLPLLPWFNGDLSLLQEIYLFMPYRTWSSKCMRTDGSMDCDNR